MSHIKFFWQLDENKKCIKNTITPIYSFCVDLHAFLLLEFETRVPNTYAKHMLHPPNYHSSLRKCYFNIIIHLEQCSVNILRAIQSGVFRDIFRHLDQIWFVCPLHFLGPVELDPLPRWNFKRNTAEISIVRVANCSVDNSIFRQPLKVAFVWGRQASDKNISIFEVCFKMFFSALLVSETFNQCSYHKYKYFSFFYKKMKVTCTSLTKIYSYLFEFYWVFNSEDALSKIMSS